DPSRHRRRCSGNRHAGVRADRRRSPDRGADRRHRERHPRALGQADRPRRRERPALRGAGARRSRAGGGRIRPLLLLVSRRRRAFLARLGIGFNAIVATLLGVPIVRYILSPITRERRPGYESWLSLGSLDQFPEGQTRFATYRNPVVNAWDGETATIACWVRR